MSLAHLLVAVREQLRDQLSGSGPAQFEKTDITIQPDEKPPVQIGKKHITVYASNWVPTEESDTTKDEQFQINCSLTFRASAEPTDRHGDSIYVALLHGMAEISNNIAFALDRNYDTINAATASASPNTTFFEPLIWQGTDASPRIVDGSWFFADPANFSGLVMESRFLGGRAITNSNLNNS